MILFINFVSFLKMTILKIIYTCLFFVSISLLVYSFTMMFLNVYADYSVYPDYYDIIDTVEDAETRKQMKTELNEFYEKYEINQDDARVEIRNKVWVKEIGVSEDLLFFAYVLTTLLLILGLGLIWLN